MMHVFISYSLSRFIHFFIFVDDEQKAALLALDDAPDEENKVRRFFFTIDKISCFYDIKFENVFIEFEFGGQSIEDETEYVVFAVSCPSFCLVVGSRVSFVSLTSSPTIRSFVPSHPHRDPSALSIPPTTTTTATIIIIVAAAIATAHREVIQKPKKKKYTKPDGTTEEKEVMESVNLKMIRVKRTPQMRYMTYQKRSVKAKATEKYQYDRVEGYWDGSYNDLQKEKLTIRVWTNRLYGGNVLVGEASERFIDIADSKVDRSVDIRKRGQAAREETVCSVKFKCEFQEWFQFQIKFQNWELSYHKEELEAGRKVIEKNWPCLCDSTSLEFHISRSQAGLGALLKNLFCPCLSSEVSFIPLQKNLKTSAGSGKDAVAIVSYPGTRTWLEDEELRVRWLKKVFCGVACCSTPVASAVLPLQGTLDYGYIISPLSVRMEACSAFCIGARCKDCFFSCCNLLHVCFGPTCNCCREGYTAIGTKLSKQAQVEEAKRIAEVKKAHFVNMTIAGVITCDTVPRYRQQGSVDPAKKTGLLALTQTRDQATYLVVKVVRAQGLKSIEEFKETLNPCVVVEWAGIQKKTKTVPNAVNPYWDYDVYFKIPDEKGPPRKFESFNEVTRNSKIVFSVWDEEGLSRSVLGYAELDFKSVFEKRVEKPIYIFSSDAKVRHLVYEPKLPLDFPFNQVADDRRSRETQKNIEADNKFLEVMVYFDRIDNIAIDSKRSKEEIAQRTLAQIEQERTLRYSRARAFWDESLRYVEARDSRYFAFFGKDEYTGEINFLPTFIKPMHPPANMKDLSEIFYYVFSMECVQKPRAHVDDVKRRQHLESNDPCSPIKYDDVWVWSDPYFFFEKKRGDLRDHAILLVNFLLGIGLPKDQFNAFVCIGTARTTKGGTPVPHTWVMTQEKFPHQRKPIVRFWELKSGQTFVLDCPRFKHVYNHEERRAHLKRLREAQMGAAAIAEAAAEEEERKKREEQEEKDMAWDKIRARMNQELEKFDVKDDAALLSLPDPGAVGGTGADANGTARDVNVYNDATRAQIEHEREGARHRLQLLQEFILEQETEYKNYKEKFWLSQKSDGSVKPRLTPYESIEVVFNHECLFANLQQANPEFIMYEFDKPKRWIEFAEQNWKECFELPVLAPFYKERAIVSVLAPEREIMTLKKDMAQRLKDSIVTHRSYHFQFETTFFDKFEFNGSVVGIETAEDYAKQRFDLELRHGMRDDLLRMCDAERATEPEKAKLLRMQVAKESAKLRKRVTSSLKMGLDYQERLFHFKHTDANRIGDQIRTKCEDLLRLPDYCHPQFQICVDIERLPGQICPVRVLVMAITGQAK